MPINNNIPYGLTKNDLLVKRDERLVVHRKYKDKDLLQPNIKNKVYSKDTCFENQPYNIKKNKIKFMIKERIILTHIQRLSLGEPNKINRNRSRAQ